MNHCKYEVEESFHPLLSAVTASPPRNRHFRLLPLFNKRHHMFPKSKAVLMILLWNSIVGATFGVLICLTIALGSSNVIKNAHKAMYAVLGVRGIIAVVQIICYPIGGLIADICCGRYKIMTLSVIKICCGFGLLSVMGILLATSHEKYDIHKGKNGPMVTYMEGIAAGAAILFFIAGFTGFQANSVQYGLDQLLDASSDELSVFLHWYVWTDSVGQAVTRLFASAIVCTNDVSKDVIKFLSFFPIVIFVTILTTLILSCCCRKWFHSEPRTHNPYGTIYQVLKFVAKHDRPIRRSALTYCDDERPTRMEFAKEKYGGPFRTETVEDVKTVLKMLTMLLAIGPVFIMSVGTSEVFPLYGLQVYNNYVEDKCYTFIIFASGNLSFLISVVFLPLYIIFLLPHVYRFVPRIFTRLGLGILLVLLTLVAMTIIYMTAKLKVSSPKNIAMSCLFNLEPWVADKAINASGYGMHYAFLSIPNVLTGVGMPIMFVTILEFVSAQSPHTMKGLLLGVFYAIRGIYYLIGYSLVLPFTNRLWKDNSHSLVDCGFLYYTSQVVVGLVGMIVFVLACRCYHFRERDDRPYGYNYVEDWYGRYIRRDTHLSTSKSPEDVHSSSSSHVQYGSRNGVAKHTQ